MTLGGTVSGLALGDTIELQDNGGDDLLHCEQRHLRLLDGLPPGSAYAVTVSSPTSPVPQCHRDHGLGTVGSSDVATVDVTCTTLTASVFTVGGTVTGLASSESLTLQNEGGDTLVVSANGSFTFPMPVVTGSSYDVTVQASPASPVAETCTVSSPSGVVGNADVTSLTVTCAPTQLTIGGTLSGLSSNDVVALEETECSPSCSAPTGPSPSQAPSLAAPPTPSPSRATRPTRRDLHGEPGQGTVGSADSAWSSPAWPRRSTPSTSP